MTRKSSKKKNIDKAVLVVGLIMALTLVAYIYFMQRSGTPYEQEYREVAAKVGPGFNKIVTYLERVDRAHTNSSPSAVKKEMEQAAARKEGEFKFRLANLRQENGDRSYCLVAEHIHTKGRAYHSSELVHDPTWQGKRSYYHFVTGNEPQPDLEGPCNEQVIRR